MKLIYIIISLFLKYKHNYFKKVLDEIMLYKLKHFSNSINI